VAKAAQGCVLGKGRPCLIAHYSLAITTSSCFAERTPLWGKCLTNPNYGRPLCNCKAYLPASVSLALATTPGGTGMYGTCSDSPFRFLRKTSSAWKKRAGLLRTKVTEQFTCTSTKTCKPLRLGLSSDFLEQPANGKEATADRCPQFDQDVAQVWNEESKTHIASPGVPLSMPTCNRLS
jgi:hypothetical protein